MAADISIHKLIPRAGGMFRVEITDPGKHFAAAILMQGGKGKLKIKSDGVRKGKKNFLIRFRESFSAKGVLVAIADAPRDHYGKKGMKEGKFRLTEDHAKDITAVIRLLRKKTDKPIWLIGTSRGTISAVNTAIRVSPEEAPAGLILTSSVLVGNKGNASIFDADLDQIQVPVFITHHREDDCFVTPFSKTEELSAAFTSASIVEFKAYEGGDAGNVDNYCNRLSHHGFLGQEERVISDIVEWMKAHNE